MVTETNQTYLNTLITSLGETYPPINGRQKRSQEETGQTREFSVISITDDKVELSPQAQEKAGGSRSIDSSTETDELSDDEKNEVSELKTTDRKVHAHEQAHMAAGGSLVRGGPSYEYETGPDGKRYAVGGEVSIDTSEVKDDPRATIIKAGRIRQAAMAPADPSSQDRTVAAEAATMAFKAQMELIKQKSGTKGKSQAQSTRIDLFA
jgi:hypothetical protein